MKIRTRLPASGSTGDLPMESSAAFALGKEIAAGGYDKTFTFGT